MKGITKTLILPNKEILELVKEYEKFYGENYAKWILAIDTYLLLNEGMVYHEENIISWKVFKKTIHVKVYC